MTQPQQSPGILARLFSRRRGARAEEPFAFHPNIRFTGLGNQPKPEALLRESIGWADIAVRAISNRIASLHFVVKVRGELAPDHPLQAILNRPSPLYSRSNTLRLISSYILNIGDSYLLKVRDGLRMPVELWPMPAHRVEPIPMNGTIPLYRVTVEAGRQIEVPADELIRTWIPDPETLYTGKGFLGSAALTLDADKFSEQTLRSHFEHDATPRTVISGDKEVASPGPDEIERLNTSWVQRYSRRLGRNRGAPAWLPAGFSIQELSALGGITELATLRNQNRDKLLMTFGVPRSIVGDVADANRAAAETNQFVFDVHTVSPLTDLISEALTFQLARMEFGPDVTVEFQQFVAKDKEFEVLARESRLRTKVSSVNMERAKLGEDLVDWGNLPIGTLADQPFTGETFEFDAGEDRGMEPLPAEPEETKSAGFDEAEAITGSSVLNGAQVTAILEISQDVAGGRFPRSSALALLGVAFGIDPSTADAILPTFGSFVQPADAAPMSAAMSTETSEARSVPVAPVREQVRERMTALGLTRTAASARRSEADERNATISRMEWQRVLLRERRFVPRFSNLMRSIFVAQEREVITALRDAGLGKRALARDLTNEQILDLMRQLFGEDDSFEDLFEMRVEPLRRRVYVEAARDAVETAATLTGLSFPPFSLSQASARILEGQAASLRTLVNEYTLKRLASEITSELVEGALLGESAASRAKRIESVVGQTMRMQRKRSLRIARTEMLKATQSAQIEGFRDTGVIEQKRWNTSQDRAVRDQHKIDGKAVPLDGNFALPGSNDGKVPAELASAPGVGADGGRLSAANAVNCRCFLTPVVDVEE